MGKLQITRQMGYDLTSEDILILYHIWVKESFKLVSEDIPSITLPYANKFHRVIMLEATGLVEFESTCNDRVRVSKKGLDLIQKLYDGR